MVGIRTFLSAALAWGFFAQASAELRVEGELRARYESLDGQFRAGLEGSDQALFTRALFLAEWKTGRWAFGAEMQDSRAFLDDEGTPLSGGFVNASDLLQAYVSVDGPGLLGVGSDGRTVIGRQTISIGSKRQVERVSYANVIRSFTGIHHTSSTERGDHLHLFAAVPVERATGGREGAAENRFVADEEQWGRRFVGLHFRRPDAFPALAPDIMAELFVYGLYEQDTDDLEGPDRRYTWPGFRIWRPKAVGRWDIDLEPSYRFGKRHASSAPSDTEDLEVEAARVIAILGYTFDATWQPRLAAEWYYASGDEDPADGSFERYERLFGSRRTDLNNTSLHGPLTYANLNAPGARLELKPNAVTDARIAWSASALASETDQFQIARLRDSEGLSGRFMGHAVDMRARYLPKGQPLVYEIGGSLFTFGEFTKNAPDAPEGSRTLFGYAQATLSF
ncbi:alginate export family protein [Parvularcula sp. ZS-1/3]|uniref:Alginate export family protein n=1 Tax=Parvularcula mediterranea TaxID=2732508 RepID=A0A7Y3RN57_9PROT|nr:alginate export family protein [Parvularcula mediterranea]NNU16710.1 alginate export family protein [Parvularcula mediterranea]